MFMDWIKKILNWIKIPLKVLLPSLAIFSGFLLLISDNFAEKLYLKEFRKLNGFAFGLIFVITITLIVVYCILFTLKPILQKYKAYIEKKKLVKKFKFMDNVYKQTLYKMYRHPTRSITMEMSNAIAAYLEDINAVGRSNIARYGYYMDYYLQPWVIWGIESEIKHAKKIIKKFDKNNLKLSKKKNYEQKKSYYEKCLVYLKYIQSQTNDDENEW